MPLNAYAMAFSLHLLIFGFLNISAIFAIILLCFSYLVFLMSCHVNQPNKLSNGKYTLPTAKYVDNPLLADTIYHGPATGLYQSTNT